MVVKNITFRLLKIVLKSILGLVIFISIYLLSAYSLSRIQVNKFAKNNGPISVYIKSNGVHTDLVLPIQTANHTWCEACSFSNTKGNDSIQNWIAFGWGDKGFYIETKKWSELKVSTAIKAAFALSSSAIHTTYYKEIKPSKTCVEIKITEKAYQKLVNYISKSFKKTKDFKTIFIPTNAVYGKDDAFYDAVGSYSMLRTCNTWANNGLKACGQKAAFWAAFESGIFCHYLK